MAVVAHGPRWQIVVIMIVAQHTSPAAHPVEVVHVTPDAPLLLLELPPPLELPPTKALPPLLALPPTIDPLLDPPPPPLRPAAARTGAHRNGIHVVAPCVGSGNGQQLAAARGQRKGGESGDPQLGSATSNHFH